MKAEIGKEIFYLTWRFIMALLIIWTGSASSIAGEGTRNTSLGKYCKILEEIFSEDRFECVIEMSAKFRPHPDPSPVRIVLTTTPFFLIQTPSALTTTRSALTTTPFALTTTGTFSPLLGEKCSVHSEQSSRERERCRERERNPLTVGG